MISFLDHPPGGETVSPRLEAHDTSVILFRDPPPGGDVCIFIDHFDLNMKYTRGNKYKGTKNIITKLGVKQKSVSIWLVGDSFGYPPPGSDIDPLKGEACTAFIREGRGLLRL